MAKKKDKPKRHKYKIGDVVNFKFAGSWHIGEVMELTKENDGHATYTATTSGNGRIYPRLGLDGSCETGWIRYKS
jgi:hypothetical protein